MTPIINKTLENVFNLAPSSNVRRKAEDTPIIEKTQDEILKEIASAQTDKEFDVLAEAAFEAHQQLMEIAVTAERRFGAEIASAASSMLGNAISARMAKVKKKLDSINLQLKKSAQEHKLKSDEDTEDHKPGILINRNELIQSILKDEAK